MRFNGVFHVARQIEVLFGINVFDTRQFLDFFNSSFGQNDGTSFLLDRIVCFWLQTWRPACKLDIVVGGFLSLSRNDERGAGFIDQDVINLVDDGIGQFTLNLLFQSNNHIVS